MDTDVALTLGIVLLVLALPSLLSAWVEGRAPRVGAILVIAAGGLIISAVTTRPGGYAFNEVPAAIINVVSRLFN
jgi:formate-dependent nitrite reductase membrane component NrfD